MTTNATPRRYTVDVEGEVTAYASKPKALAAFHAAAVAGRTAHVYTPGGRLAHGYLAEQGPVELVDGTLRRIVAAPAVDVVDEILERHPEVARKLERAEARTTAEAAATAREVERAAAPVSATPSQRTTLARVVVGDQLMTATDPDGLVVPFRWANGTVRTVADRLERKAGPDEMPGKLVTLVFTDGTRTAERYGTTSHYRAAVFAPAPAVSRAVPAEARRDQVTAPVDQPGAPARRWQDDLEAPLPAGTLPGVVAMNDRIGLARDGEGRLRPQLLGERPRQLELDAPSKVLDPHRRTCSTSGMTTKRTARTSPAAGRQLALELTTGAFGTTRIDRTPDEDGAQLDLFEAVAEATR